MHTKLSSPFEPELWLIDDRHPFVFWCTQDQHLKRFGASWDISGLRDISQSAPPAINEHLNSEGEMSSSPSTEAAAGDSWLEFPVDKLILGQVLHEGAFTQVLKGEAEGLNNIDEHIVVVKTLKGKPDLS